MFSVFFHMSEFMINVIFAILEKVMLGEKPAFVEEYRFTLQKPEHGWVMSAIGDEVFAEYRSKNLFFRPKLSVLHQTEAIKNMRFIREPIPHERIYMHWRETASDTFFKDVEALFKRIQAQERGG